MASESKKRLALAIIDFLNKSGTDGTLPADEAESITVATQIIADAFKVDPSDTASMADALGGQSLVTIYGVFEKMKGRAATKPPTPAQPANTPSPTSAQSPTPEQKAEADALKGQGNEAMAKKDYPTAIDLYTKALGLTPGNPIFLSNRAAAYSASRQHQQAAVDAQAAVAADPSYSKAWSRLGLAKFALGDTKGAMEAYAKGMEVESSGGKNPSEAMRRGFETAKKRLAEEDGEEDIGASGGMGGMGGMGGGMPDLSSLASMFGGGGGGGEGGGMPDLAGLMSNPMISQLASNLMKNPDMLGKMMNNPKVKEMMDGVSGGGGLPDMSSMMNDANFAEMAKNFMKDAGGSGRSPGPSDSK
ncbi:small glutamine-rich tetratricopeptide repeat-containing protein 2-like protein [Terfezia boudieri ATCC MYA-4762]|uniref:Small glutamine-rich tetratricopeptide repeat-containing protein 2-like protein n=1 Tax=Terfezia boudieri ATCC MYA-4762 TaxID=1051890 RepID=A0A3N4M038_9PEZI|nr:small glutamine-rich tetratricopeptide repeat-containing protein 2-like protein [Terfezia boudieri ATCC MYA-4762]